MKRFVRLTLAALFSASLAPLNADVTPTDVKNKANESAATIQKNKDEAVKKATTEQDAPAEPTPAPKRKRPSFFGDKGLSGDRSQQPYEKPKMSDESNTPKDPPYKNLSKELHKER